MRGLIENCVLKDERTGRWAVWYNGEWYYTADTYEEADRVLQDCINAEWDPDEEEQQ